MISFYEGKLLIEEIKISDLEIIRYLTNNLCFEDNESFSNECEARLLKALRVGSVALQRAETQVDLDAIRREFDGFHSDIGKSFKDIENNVKKALEENFDGDRGRLTLVLERYLGQGGMLSDLFNEDRKSSAIGKIQSIFEEHFGGDSSKFTRLLDCTLDASPLKKFYEGLDKRLKEIDDRLIDLQKKFAADEARNEEHERGTQKGGDFEQLIFDVLESMATNYNDIVTRVGSQINIGPSKKGDLLININSGDVGGQDVSIVIEAKREKTKSLGGKNGILEELNEAKKNRNSEFAIAVFSDDACPKGINLLRDFPENRMVCSVPADMSQSLVLEAAYRIARAEICYQKRHTSKDIDQTKISDLVKQVEGKLIQFSGLKSKATSLSTIAGEIRSQLDLIESDIRSSIRMVLTAMEPVNEVTDLGIPGIDDVPF